MEKMVSLSGVSVGNKGHNGGRALDTCQELGEGHLFPFAPTQDSPTGSACQPSGVGGGRRRAPLSWPAELPVLLTSGGPARWMSTWTASCSLSLSRPPRKQLVPCWAPIQPSGSSSVLARLSKEQPTHHSVGIGKQDSLSLTYQFIF